MDSRVGLLFLIVVAGHWLCDARNLAASDLLGVENYRGDVDVCGVCKEYAALALDYVTTDKTQAKVVEALHKACADMRSLKQQCIMLVDYYAPLFFLEVSSVKPKKFCKKVGLCRNARMASLSVKKNKCDLCRSAVDEVLFKLNDPDTKLGVIEALLKVCNVVEQYMKQCKSMVFEFGPLIFSDAEKFIQKVDICTTFHACGEPKVDAESATGERKIEMVTSS